MKIDYKKMTTSYGASMVIALVVFLIAALFSMTIVTGALTGLQNVNRQQDEEQLYLAATSAADVVEHCVSDGAIWTLEITDEDGNAVKLTDSIKEQIRSLHSDFHEKDEANVDDKNGKYYELLNAGGKAVVSNGSENTAFMNNIVSIFNEETTENRTKELTISPTETEYSNLACELTLSYTAADGITAKIQPSTTTAGGSSLYSNNITVVFEENTKTVFANTVSVEDAEYTITVTEHTFKNYTVKKGISDE